jgi:hypothetical protein
MARYYYAVAGPTYPVTAISEDAGNVEAIMSLALIRSS